MVSTLHSCCSQGAVCKTDSEPELNVSMNQLLEGKRADSRHDHRGFVLCSTAQDQVRHSVENARATADLSSIFCSWN